MALLPKMNREPTEGGHRPAVIDVSTGLSSFANMSNPQSPQYKSTEIFYASSKTALNAISLTLSKMYPALRVGELSSDVSSSDCSHKLPLYSSLCPYLSLHSGSRTRPHCHCSQQLSRHADGRGGGTIHHRCHLGSIWPFWCLCAKR
jgi:hypothetical protein